MGWQGIVVLLRLRVFAVWAAFPVVLVALIASEDLRLALMAWMGTMWIVFAWFWLARFKTVSWRLISGVFAIGMPWAGVIAWLSSGLADSARVPIDDAAAQVVIASIVEEVLKLAPLVVIALVAPGRARRFLVTDWLVLGVGLGAGFEAVEEMIRRLTFLSGAMRGGWLDRLLCPADGAEALECLGFPMFGLSPFSGAGGEAYAYCGHAILTGLVAGSIGLARHLWWRSAGHGPASIAVIRVFSALLPLGALWLAVVDHMGRNASGYEPWGAIGGEAPWDIATLTADLTGDGSGRGWLLVLLLVVGPCSTRACCAWVATATAWWSMSMCSRAAWAVAWRVRPAGRSCAPFPLAPSGAASRTWSTRSCCRGWSGAWHGGRSPPGTLCERRA